MNAGPPLGIPPPGRGGPQYIPRPEDAVVDGAAPWADLPADARRPTIDHIRRVLADGPEPATADVEGYVRYASAVIAPLYEHNGEPWLVLTRRAWHMRAHKGEVSFPGGRQDPGESLWETATREAFEEIALDPELPEQIGELDHLTTMSSQSFIVPFVGLLPGRPRLKASDEEVDAIIHVPIAELLEPANYRREIWTFGGMRRPLHFFELIGDTVWGATGSMLVDFLTRITAT